MENYDELSSTIYSNIGVPQEQERKNANTIDKIFKKGKGKKQKKIISIFAIIPVIFTLSFAAYKSSFNLSSVGIDNPRIESLVENEITKINTEVQEYNGLSVNLTKFYEDENNFLIEFQASSTKLDISKIDDVYVRNLQIFDEKGNQIFDDSEDEKMNLKNLLNTTGFTKANVDDGKIYFTFFGTADNLQASKKVFVKFDGIDLVNKKHKTRTFNGDWNFEFDIN